MTPYVRAVEFRNLVAHRGKWPGDDEVRRSLDAVRIFIDRLEGAVQPIREAVAGS